MTKMFMDITSVAVNPIFDALPLEKKLTASSEDVTKSSALKFYSKISLYYGLFVRVSFTYPIKNANVE